MEIPVRMPQTRTDPSNWESTFGLFSLGQSTSQKNRRIVATRDDVKGLPLIGEFQSTLRMKFDDKLMNTLANTKKKNHTAPTPNAISSE